MTQTKGWVSSRYGESDVTDSLALVKGTWPDIEATDPAYHEWQHQRSPAGPAIAMLARDEAQGKLVGQEVTIPVKLSLAGEERLGSLSLNSVTDPEWRGRGIFKTLLSEVCDVSAREGIALTYGFPNQSSYPIFVRTGFTDIGAVPLLIRPLSPERLAYKRTGNRLLARLASAARVVWRAPKESTGGPEIVRIARFDDSFTAFWQRAKGNHPVMVARDAAYLNWRFVDVPLREYAIFAALSGGKTRGFIALRRASVAQFDAGMIVDFVVERTEEGLAAGRRLVQKACSHFYERDLDMIGSLALAHTQEYRLLRDAGFWVCPKRLEPQPFPVIVRRHDSEDSPSRLAYDIKNWFLTMGDYDVV